MTAKEITAADGSDGKLTVQIAGAIGNCPFVEVPTNN